MSPRIQGRSISRSIASPRSNITAFLNVTVNGVRRRGDVVWFRGASRLVFHGVEGIRASSPGFSTELDFRMGESDRRFGE